MRCRSRQPRWDWMVWSKLWSSMGAWTNQNYLRVLKMFGLHWVLLWGSAAVEAAAVALKATFLASSESWASCQASASWPCPPAQLSTLVRTSRACALLFPAPTTEQPLHIPGTSPSHRPRLVLHLLTSLYALTSPFRPPVAPSDVAARASILHLDRLKLPLEAGSRYHASGQAAL